MSMKKKDYELIAEVLRPAEDNGREHHTELDIIYTMADALAEQNKRFDRAKFLQQCGVTD